MQKIRLAEMGTLVKKVLGRLPQKKEKATIVCLVGELGAGKTTFVQALAKELGIVEVVQSPTYVLMKKYQVTSNKFQVLIHIDAYRLKNAQEFSALKPETFLRDPHNLICIEWPERVEGALPKPDLVINFSSENSGEKDRFIKIEK